MAQSYIKRILNAQVYDVARETPLDAAPLLSARLGNQAFLKREDLQPVFSFKCRGAYNKMVHLDEAARAGGVVAALGPSQGLLVAVHSRALAPVRVRVLRDELRSEAHALGRRELPAQPQGRLLHPAPLRRDLPPRGGARTHEDEYSHGVGRGRLHERGAVLPKRARPRQIQCDERSQSHDPAARGDEARRARRRQRRPGAQREQ